MVSNASSFRAWIYWLAAVTPRVPVNRVGSHGMGGVTGRLLWTRFASAGLYVLDQSEDVSDRWRLRVAFDHHCGGAMVQEL